MQFALEVLGFKPENIILFGWSIGGFSTSYAAMNYPDVKAVVSLSNIYIFFNLLFKNPTSCVGGLVGSTLALSAGGADSIPAAGPLNYGVDPVS